MGGADQARRQLRQHTTKVEKGEKSNAPGIVSFQGILDIKATSTYRRSDHNYRVCGIVFTTHGKPDDSRVAQQLIFASTHKRRHLATGAADADDASFVYTLAPTADESVESSGGPLLKSQVMGEDLRKNWTMVLGGKMGDESDGRSDMSLEQCTFKARRTAGIDWKLCP
ncbi:hypothetical protein TcWFU_004771 [Taenia crassiceps]|uniref:Uncharacterized protein n=1 Tax=Taenia crassiceps TaxID=6207 RepID=A0ABR4QL54_9CEST